MRTDADLYEKQAELEIEMQSRGAIRYRQMTEKALEKGRAAQTAPGTFFLVLRVWGLAAICFNANPSSWIISD